MINSDCLANNTCKLLKIRILNIKLILLFYCVLISSAGFSIQNIDCSNCFCSNFLSIDNQQNSISKSSSWPYIQLTASCGTINTSTVVAFNSKMTLGLDVTYDAGLLRGSSGLYLYTRLVEDNGVDFAIQCLPTSYINLLIPIGLECKTGGSVTFSVETSLLPADGVFEFIDSVEHVTTSLTGGNFSYTTTVSANSKGFNRFYFRFKKAPAISVWSGTGSWSESANWSNGLPDKFTDATINSGHVTVDGNYSVNCLSVNSNALLTINQNNALTVNGNLNLKSDANSTASLIVYGGLNVVGKTFAERYLSGNCWHIITPVVAGQSISSFIQNENNSIPYKEIEGVKCYGVMDYNQSRNLWNNYYASDVSQNLEAGKGYCALREADGIFTFEGTVLTGDKTVLLERGMAESGWNCIGNVYTSSLDINNDMQNSFLAINSESFDENYGAIYLWNGSLQCYNIIGNANYSFTTDNVINQHYIAPGQGFMVKAANSSAAVNYHSSMQLHQSNSESPLLKSAKKSWPAIQLTISNEAKKYSTVVAFNNQMTNGVDRTYDAGLLRGSSDLYIYSHLPDNDSVDFAVQCLPENFDNLNIPIGIDCINGGEVSFTAEYVEIPNDITFELFDSIQNAVIPINSGFVYNADVEANNFGTGRFYLRTKSSNTTTYNHYGDKYNVSVFVLDKLIHINGNPVGCIAQLFNVNGCKISTYRLINSNEVLNAEALSSGVYVLRIYANTRVLTFKIVIR
jgi:hypothetical protein